MTYAPKPRRRRRSPDLLPGVACLIVALMTVTVDDRYRNWSASRFDRPIAPLGLIASAAAAFFLLRGLRDEFLERRDPRWRWAIGATVVVCVGVATRHGVRLVETLLRLSRHW